MNLQEILHLHVLWLKNEEGGVRANLEGANLKKANLKKANLEGANLYRANLEGANLERANLEGANLYRASLYGANLEGANLYRASLYGANLERANLEGANLERANLEGANIKNAILDEPIARLDFGGWSICIRKDKTTIGCQSHPNEKWLAWTAECEDIKNMHKNASKWWSSHGEAVKSVIRCVMSK